MRCIGFASTTCGIDQSATTSIQSAATVFIVSEPLSVFAMDEKIFYAKGCVFTRISDLKGKAHHARAVTVD
jgi:hypothetical protein